MLTGKVLITGGAGFLGRGILRRAEKENWPCEFIVYSRDEYKQVQCKVKYPNAKYVVGDICDYDSLYKAFVGIDTVIHAAAIKDIATAEANARETVRINVHGSQNVINAAIHAGVKKVIGISTDKAVQPINTYGITKALMERLFHGMDPKFKTIFSCVRYGNVVGSTGSVIPIFQQQVKNKDCITVTDIRMTRFWMSVDDAIDLITTAHDTNYPGQILVAKPTSMYLMDLVHCFTDNVRIIGPRKGEKTHEELLSLAESANAMEYDKYYILNCTTTHETFIVSSSCPPSGFVKKETMLAWIDDALHV